MLRQLHIENYTLIDRLDLVFHPGFNVLTGETGSGKSIVVDAMELLLGEKASADVIRTGSDRAQITGVFSPLPSSSKTPSLQWKRLRSFLSESGIELEDGEDLILHRDIQTGGKSRILVNHRPATAGLLKAISFYLAEVHGQHDQQELFSPKAQLEMLDRFGGIADQATDVREKYEAWRALREEQAAILLRQQETLRQLDLWQFQNREIEQASVQVGEDQKLEQEKLILANAARIHAAIASAYDLLYDAESSSTTSLSAACKSLDQVSSFDSSLKPIVENLKSAMALAEDAAYSLRDRLTELEISPLRLEEVEDRLALLDRLKRKYGPTLEDVMRYWDQVAQKLQEAESGEELGAALEAKSKKAAEEFRAAAASLSAKRREAAADLKRDIERELKALAMSETRFDAGIESCKSDESDTDKWSWTGFDRVDFLVSPNPGEPLRPLAKIASGGEVSRIMLALETATDARRGARFRDHTLVFDEVDAGIGGRAAETVGMKLRQLGESRQVLCVTHLPQIASYAHHHYSVEKTTTNGRTATKVEQLSKQARTEELARMLSGSKITDAILKHAEQLLKANS
jgi:DNA repair protein RecN (Recombination protein N)